MRLYSKWDFVVDDGPGRHVKIGYVPGKGLEPDAEIIVATGDDPNLPHVSLEEFESMTRDISQALLREVKIALDKEGRRYESLIPAPPSQIFVAVRVGSVTYGGRIRKFK